MTNAQYEGILFGMCNPLLDISAEVPMDMVKKYDAPFGNACLAEEKHMPVYDELLQNHKVDLIAGGATQNVLRVFQWTLNKGPKVATFVGSVGDDEFGTLLKQKAEESGLNVQYHVEQGAKTGTCACLVVGGERALIANLGAANLYKIEHLRSEPVQKHVKQAQYYYISGFFLTVCPEGIMEVAKHAAEENKVFAMNISATFIADFFTEKFMAALPYMDYLFGNEDEAKALSKTLGFGTDDVQEIAKRLSVHDKVNKNRPRTVVFTEGSKPVKVAIAQAGSSLDDVQTAQFPVQPVTNIVDTNGAGDSFCGGFLAMLVQDKPLETCVAAGTYSAGVVIQNSGATWGDAKPYEA